MLKDSPGKDIDRIGQLSVEKQLELRDKLRALEIAKCADSFPYFLFKYVRTKDEHDRTSPVKPVPRKRYLEFIANEFETGPSVQYYAKSRQLMVSWMLAAKTVHRILFFPHSLVLFQSKKLEDASKMIFEKTPNVARASFIMANLPDWMQVCVCETNGKRWNKQIPLNQTTFSEGKIILPNGSVAEALAQGAAQVEGRVPSLFISDESSLQEEWGPSWSAVMPCISNGGQAIAVATMRLPSAYGEEVAPCAEVDPDSEFRGVARFTTARGGSGVRIHYSADPDKDPLTEHGLAWYTGEIANYRGGADSVDWRQHMEIDPSSESGELCIPYWSKIKDRVVIPDIDFDTVTAWTVGGGADYGLRNPTVVLYCAVDYNGDYYVLDELAAPGKDSALMREISRKRGWTHSGRGGVAGLSELIQNHPLHGRTNGRIQMDPTIWKEDQNRDGGGLTSVASMFARESIYFQPAKQRGQDADDLTLNMLHDLWGGYDDEDMTPRLFICQRCTGLISALGRLRYQDWNKSAQEVNDLKKKMRGGVGLDYFDALKHWIVSLPPKPGILRGAPPTMSFDWFRNRALKDASTGRYARS